MNLALIILLASAVGWLGWRLLALRRGIDRLTAALRADPPPRLGNIPRKFSGKNLRSLNLAALDVVAEATLERDAESNRRQFLETLLNEINDAIIIVDHNLDIRFVNETARRLFPSEQPPVGRQLFSLCRDHRIVETVELADEIGGKVSEKVSLQIKGRTSKQLREYNFLVEAEPFTPSEDGKVAGAWLLMRDITKELETDQIRRDFVANASHELRTPLSIINGYLETLTYPDTDLNTEQNRRFLNTMKVHAERISRIVDDMLTISKLENAEDMIKRESFDLKRPIERMLDHLHPLIEQNDATVTVNDGGREDWPFLGDPFYWDQIFFNLIENALKQNPQPGLKIKIKLRENRGRYEIDVSDNGVGIPAADLPVIFKRFYRVEKHHAQLVKGTGLGLSIVKRAVEAHHGTITVESQPWKRTTFTISVPAPPPRSHAHANHGDDELAE